MNADDADWRDLMDGFRIDYTGDSKILFRDSEKENKL